MSLSSGLLLHCLLFKFCPGVAQRHDTVEYVCTIGIVCRIFTEIAEPFELHGLINRCQ